MTVQILKSLQQIKDYFILLSFSNNGISRTPPPIKGVEEGTLCSSSLGFFGILDILSSAPA